MTLDCAERLMQLWTVSSSSFTAENIWEMGRTHWQHFSHLPSSYESWRPPQQLCSSLWSVWAESRCVVRWRCRWRQPESPYTAPNNRHTALSKCHNGSDESWLQMASHNFIQAYIKRVRACTCDIMVHTSGNPTSTSNVKRLVLLSCCGNCWMQWSVNAATTAHHWEEIFRFRKISATEHAQSRPMRLL